MTIVSKLNIYKIDSKYIEYLQQFEKCIVEQKIIDPMLEY